VKALLGNEEKAFLYQLLSEFQRQRNVSRLVGGLRVSPLN
jgi:hypothetical protein